ncbi:hypothetical protein WJT86_03605 [Microvirga sp. W0021]|uniref:Uncharacterized protein n=1 Tax=Hohaiivirga grylli TaxID=3133970 RepID=A0ABV0BIR8_9HYPH
MKPVAAAAKVGKNEFSTNIRVSSIPSNKIDRLLYAIASKDDSFKETLSHQSGNTAVALDSITRWMNKTETRLSSIQHVMGQHQKLLVALCDFLTEKRAAPVNTRAQKRPIAANAVRLNSLTHAISVLESGITRLEQRTRTHSILIPLSPVTALPNTVSVHPSTKVEPSQAPAHYFARMTAQLEIVGQELQRIKAARAVNKQAEQAIPLLLSKIEALASAQSPNNLNKHLSEIVHLSDTVGGKLQSVIETINQISVRFSDTQKAEEALKADIAALKEHITALDQRSDNRPDKAVLPQPELPSSTSQNVDSADHVVLNDFITAARYANHQTTPRHSRFLRSEVSHQNT